jgi:hypothetical protein
MVCEASLAVGTQQDLSQRRNTYELFLEFPVEYFQDAEHS